jgi:UDP-N-acetylmuramoyl-L-alanyl-D-glutamate-L-lysine ligase
MKSTMLLSLLKIKTTYGNFPETVKDITSDSREMHEDSVFVAIKGHQTDGLYFADDVIQRGCRFIVADRYIDLPDHVGLLVVKDPGKTAALFAEYIYDFPHESQTMIGVTGTNGKTTVSTMIHNLSMALDKKSAYLGTNGFMINEDHIVSANTTPETTRLHKRLREAHDNDTEVFTMEVSSHGLKLGRTFGVNFDIAIFTNLTQDHLDFHNSMDEYGHIKGLLFSQLGQDVKKHKYVVLNNDDKWSEVYKDMTPFETISYGMDSTADFYPTEIEGSLEGFNFTLNTPEGRFKVNSPFVGEYNIQNLMCAIISEWLQGYEFERILEAVPAMKPVDGRLEVLDPSLPVNIIIDFAHTPDALRKVINTVQPFVSGKLTCLIGMTGERDYSKGAEMGEIATLADYAIFTPDNPANDDPAMLVKLLEEGAVHDNFTSFTDREEGIIHAVNNAEPGDTIILACKGREPYQIVEDYVKMPHRDDLIALDAAYRKYRSEEYVDGSSKI